MPVHEEPVLVKTFVAPTPEYSRSFVATERLAFHGFTEIGEFQQVLTYSGHNVVMSSVKNNQENPLVNLLANVVLPVVVLNKLSTKAPMPALLLALAFPLGYGLWSYWQTKKINFISLLGLANTLFTGGFAILKLEGIWFVVKEAAFPFLIGCFVLISSFRAQPFLKMMLFETGALNSDEILNR
ncbi:hypothetical protein K2X05_14570, partial [bacterium]|nr:hypothetical protein [bacterium]